MKILKIFGIVVAVHAAAFMFVFAIPGCRSTTRRAPSPSETATTGTGEPTVYYPGLTGYSTTTPPSADTSSPVSNNELNPGVASAPLDFGTSSVSTPEPGTVRFNPTRPNTATASALQTAPVTDVQQVTTHTIASGESLWVIARKHGVTVAEIEAANNLKSGAVLAVGKKLVIPAKTPAAGSGVSGDTMIYKVKSGDSLSVIARRAGTTTGAIRKLNNLRGDTLIVGQELTLPSGSDTAASIATTPASPVVKASVNDIEHTVQPNESLGAIARRYGVTQRSIGTANNIADPSKIRVGQKLIIPGVARSSAPSSTPAPAQPAPQPAAETPVYQPPVSSPVSPVSPVTAPESGSPISAPSDQPPVVPVEGGSPIAPGS